MKGNTLWDIGAKFKNQIYFKDILYNGFEQSFIFRLIYDISVLDIIQDLQMSFDISVFCIKKVTKKDNIVNLKIIDI